MFKTNFSEHNKIWGEQKNDLGITSPECSPMSAGLGRNRRLKVFHWRPSCLCRGLDILKIYI